MKDEETPGESLITVGRVLKVWALKGELLVLPLTFDPERFFSLDNVTIEFKPPRANNDLTPMFVERRRLESVKLHKDLLLIRIEGCTTPEDAGKYRGALLKIDRSESPELPEGVYYHYQITGLKVYTVEGECIGEVKEIVEAGANDVYVVRGGGREYLLPAIREVVRDIDLETGRMTVKLMEEV